MFMEITLPKMAGLLGMMMTMISPSRREFEVPPAESLPRRAKVLLPKFRLETAMLRLESPLQDERVVGDDDDDDFPLREGSFPGGIAPLEGKSAPAQVPHRDGSASSRKSFPCFFLGQNDLYTRRGALEMGRGGHNPPGPA